MSEDSDRAAFADMVLEAVRASGETRPVHYDPQAFAVEIGTPGPTAGHTMFLANTFVEWRKLPAAERQSFVRRWVGSTSAPPGLPTAFLSAQSKLLPVLRSRGYSFGMRAMFLERGAAPDKVPRHPRRVLTPFHHLGCAYDTETSLMEISADQLAGWKVSLDEALEAATNNLAVRSTEPFLKVSPGLFKAPWTDAYAASRLALPGLFRKIGVKGDPVALALNRDLLYVAGADDPVGLAALLEAAKQPGASERPISLAPIVLRGERWEPFAPPAGHPLSNACAELLRVATAADYAEQAAFLKADAKARKQDVFVASCTAARRPDGSSMIYATWTKGVPTLLPQVDLVLLIDIDLPEDQQMQAAVPWATLVEHVKGLQPQGLDPERYHVPDFPEGDLLAKLKALAKPQR